MSIIQGDIPGARVLDLFAGSGALGLEALSRGASSATFVEIAQKSLAALRDNAQALGADDAVMIHKMDAMRFIERLEPDTYDVAFADPPYRLGLAPKVAEAWLAKPFSRVIGIEHEKGVAMPGNGDRRTYGDTVVTFYRTG